MSMSKLTVLCGAKKKQHTKVNLKPFFFCYTIEINGWMNECKEEEITVTDQATARASEKEKERKHKLVMKSLYNE